MHTDMMPDKSVMCHRTGFVRTCHECVTQHGCRLWKRVEMEANPETGAPMPPVYDCMDSVAHIYAIDTLRRITSVTASVDALRKEVVQANDSGLASALMGINTQVRRLADTRDAEVVSQIVEAQPQKMLEAT